MNIYFTASIAGKKNYLSNYLKIVDILKSQGHKVTSDHIIKSNEFQINNQSKEDREKFHKILKKWIMEADCAVVETSFPSISVGFEISLALSFGKSVLLLYTEESPTLLSSYESEKLICAQYKIVDLKDILADFINYVHGKSEHRFTFFISSQIANFLEEVSRKKKVPKSVYLRSLIEKEANK